MRVCAVLTTVDDLNSYDTAVACKLCQCCVGALQAGTVSEP